MAGLVAISAILSIFFIVGSCWTLIQTQSIVEDHKNVSTELTVILLGATAFQTIFVAGDTLAQIWVEALGTGLMALVIVQEEVRHALFACFLMDAFLTHVWAVLAHSFHSHVPLRTGFQAHSLVQDKAFFTRMTVGGISLTRSARRAAGFTYAVFCIKALWAAGVAPAFVEEERAVRLRLALFAKISSGTRGTVFCTVLTAATLD